VILAQSGQKWKRPRKIGFAGIVALGSSRETIEPMFDRAAMIPPCVRDNEGGGVSTSATAGKVVAIGE
jgi:hypothetical protein